MTKLSTKAVDILLDEYKLQKQELLLQIQLYHRQTEFIQLYAAFVASLIAVLTALQPPGAATVGSLPHLSVAEGSWTSLLLLILGAAVAFYLVSAAMSSSLMFLVLRRRMATIEEQIGAALGDANLLVYERKIAPRFLERSFYQRGFAAPHFLSGVFRIAALSALVGLFVAVARALLDDLPELFYSATVIFVALGLVGQYIRLGLSGHKIIDATFTTPIASSPSKLTSRFRIPVGLFLNYIAVIGLLYFSTYGDFRGLLDKVSEWALGTGVSSLSPGDRLFGISVYTFLAGTILPTPSEAPILLFHGAPELSVLVASAVGKGLGAAALVWFVVAQKQWLVQNQWLPEGIVRSLPSIDGSLRGWALYFACQAIPFAPMRLSTAVLGSVVSRKRTAFIAGLVCAAATIPRMLVMWLLVRWVGIVLEQ